MSNETKKALLNEHTTRRFWKLAGLRPIHEESYIFEDEEEINEEEEELNEEEEELNEEEEELEEIGMKGMKGMGKMKGAMMGADEDEEPMDDEEEVDDMGDLPSMADDEPVEDDPMGDEPMGDEPMDAEPGGDMQDVEVDVPEGDVGALETARDILTQILDAVKGEEDEGAEMDDMGAEPEPAAEDPEALEEDDEPFEISEDNLNETVERIASRIANRIYETMKK